MKRKRMKKKLFRRTISTFLVLSFFLQGLTPVYAAENTEAAKKEIQAEDADVQESFEIRTEEDLRQFAQNCAWDSWSVGKTFVLTENISIKNCDFFPIPTFGGTFDGNGHTISGINLTDSLSPAGVFASVQKTGVVKELKVIGRVETSGQADNVGGLAGRNWGRISDCSFQGYVKGENNVGGIAGVNESGGEICNCNFDGDVLGNHSTGGITGYNLGIVRGCENLGDVNIDGEDIEYKMTELSLNSLVNFNSTQNLTAHTDTGGIAGFSEGIIYECRNIGTVGYPHIGYNIGGIAGRCKQSYIQSCTNEGKVYGRKDVGGVAGQIEPLLEIEYIKDKFQILDEELDKFIDLMEQTYSDMDQMNHQALEYVKDISYYINTAGTAANGLSSDSQDYYDSLNQGMDSMSQGIQDLQKDLKDISLEKLEPEENSGISGNDILQKLPSVSENNISLKNYEDEIHASKDALDSFLGNAGDRASDLSESSKEYGEDMKDHMSAIHANLEEAGKRMDDLSEILLDGSENVSQDMSAVMDQAKVVRRVIREFRDEVFEYEDAALQDVSAEESASSEEVPMGAGTGQEASLEEAEDIGAFQKGKIARCLNKGAVEADINVGGIAGVMATEYDTDPEDDIEIVGETSLKATRKVSVVIRDSRNEGSVTSKKDCVGGILGKAEVGALISCENYGSVESSGGNYVGGIVGKTAGTVKACYAKCTLSGDSCIGGIIGEGTSQDEEEESSSVSGCYAMVEIVQGKQFLGAIAGKEDGSFYDNHFVSDSLQGINRVNYHGKAEPMDYEDVVERESMVAGFKTLTVTFVLEEEILSVRQIQYGQSLSSLAYPEIPEKEGCYVVWDKTKLQDLRNDTVVTASYVPYIMSASSKECREDTRPVFLAEGEFKEGEFLTLTDKYEDTKQNGLRDAQNIIKEEKILEHWILNIPNNTDREEFVVHYLKEDAYKKVKIYVYENKKWKKVSWEEEGSYALFTVTGSRAEIVITK